jgi:heme/copper-type cytochrome/quinol oxidase subunit 2
LTYLFKLIYMIKYGTFGDATDILSSSKFWEPEEIWFGIALWMVVALYIVLFLIYLVFLMIWHACRYGGRSVTAYACPTCFEFCCLDEVERLTRRLERDSVVV